MPQLQDPNFARTVVLLCDFVPEGAFGLVLNRPTDRGGQRYGAARAAGREWQRSALAHRRSRRARPRLDPERRRTGSTSSTGRLCLACFCRRRRSCFDVCSRRDPRRVRWCSQAMRGGDRDSSIRNCRNPRGSCATSISISSSTPSRSQHVGDGDPAARRRSVGAPDVPRRALIQGSTGFYEVRLGSTGFNWFYRVLRGSGSENFLER